jgi:hypothetical protein
MIVVMPPENVGQQITTLQVESLAKENARKATPAFMSRCS